MNGENGESRLREVNRSREREVESRERLRGESSEERGESKREVSQERER